ncbi:hypothetical protein C7441_12148 [Pseudaminobacter salicylatoxidans]|uniref:HEPN domain-containing protein n=1 Tax=Pseudaminobacter salicylatoxidans TaxID=93369 RepID=A0A316BU22_PSESE|nr:hypothetical protein [Pseudaminobacter salicylatoxidans]PWJ75266.1 hypothetical protein C7441_12148 [Pseudaminobacter salicylatoxidans]
MSIIDDQMNAEQERAFLAWRDLRSKALETGDKTDAHAAGKAFASFFYLYVANTYRPSSAIGRHTL